jgi:membrane protein YdbS with pleckstrin-like domain
MADNRSTTTLTTEPISTLNVGPAPAPVPTAVSGQIPDAPSPQGSKVPDPTGTLPEKVHRQEQGAPTDPVNGIGMEGEEDVWVGRYSMRNFLGRALAWAALTIAWIALALYTWGDNHSGMSIPTWIATAVLAYLWLSLLVQMARAWLGHSYRLTTRRLFVGTGIASRESDQLELLRVQDISTLQPTLLQRWLNLGTVVVISSEKNLPNFHILGVSEPKQVQDLIWHHARAEQDQRNLRVEQL